MSPTGYVPDPTIWVDPLGLSRICGVTHATRDPYAGVREASALLRSRGVPRQFRVQTIRSFEIESIRVRLAGTHEFGLRYYDDVDAFANGRYLFETFPGTRENLALLSRWNKMTKIKQWRIRPGSMMLEGNAAPQGIGYPGGKIQKYVLDPNTDLLP